MEGVWGEDCVLGYGRGVGRYIIVFFDFYFRWDFTFIFLGWFWVLFCGFLVFNFFEIRLWGRWMRLGS